MRGIGAFREEGVEDVEDIGDVEETVEVGEGGMLDERGSTFVMNLKNSKKRYGTLSRTQHNVSYS